MRLKIWLSVTWIIGNFMFASVPSNKILQEYKQKLLAYGFQLAPKLSDSKFVSADECMKINQEIDWNIQPVKAEKKLLKNNSIAGKTYVLAGVCCDNDQTWTATWFKEYCNTFRALGLEKEDIFLYASGGCQQLATDAYGLMNVRGDFNSQNLVNQISSILSSAESGHLILLPIGHGGRYESFGLGKGGWLNTRPVYQSNVPKELQKKIDFGFFTESTLAMQVLIFAGTPTEINKLSPIMIDEICLTNDKVMIKVWSQKLTVGEFIDSPLGRIAFLQEERYTYPESDLFFWISADSLFKNIDRNGGIATMEDTPRQTENYHCNINLSGKYDDVPFLRIIGSDTLLCLAIDADEDIFDHPSDLYCSGIDFNKDNVIGGIMSGEGVDLNNNGQDDLIYVPTLIMMANNRVMYDVELLQMFPPTKWKVSGIFNFCMAGGFGNFFNQVPADKVFFISSVSDNEIACIGKNFLRILFSGLPKLSQEKNYFTWGDLGQYVLTNLNELAIQYPDEAVYFNKIMFASRSSKLTSLSQIALDQTANEFIFSSENFSTQVGEEERLLTPVIFKLEGNYPNPFNSNTLISYSLPKSGKVQVKIFNLLGQEVEELVNEVQMSGEHFVIWQANRFSSGKYVCQLITNSGIKTSTMVLIK